MDIDWGIVRHTIGILSDRFCGIFNITSLLTVAIFGLGFI